MNPISMNQAGIDMLCQLEGYKSMPYLCPAGKWTIGIGTTILPNGKPVTISTPRITKEIALQYAQSYLTQIYEWIAKNCKWQMTQGNYNALCSFLYNTGIGNKFNSYVNTKQAIISGDKPNIIKGMQSVNNKGLLTNRRNIEIAMFNS